MKRVLLTNVRPDLIEGDYVASLFDPFGDRLDAAHPIFQVCQKFAPNSCVRDMASDADRRLRDLDLCSWWEQNFR